MCPMSCQLCKRLCANPDHLHGLQAGAVHLCGFAIPVSFMVFFLYMCIAGKNTRVQLSAQQTEYAKSTRPHNLLRLPLLGVTKHSSIRRLDIFHSPLSSPFKLLIFFLSSTRKVCFDAYHAVPSLLTSTHSCQTPSVCSPHYAWSYGTSWKTSA
jgi:hypothetical protein